MTTRLIAGAGRLAFEHERLEIGATGVERGRPAGGTGTDDDEIAGRAGCHGVFLSQCGGYGAGETLFGRKPNQAIDGLAVLKHHHGWDTHDVELLRELGVFINV